MKRKKTEIKKRTFAMQNALPRFVSIVDRGANLIPLSLVKANETAQFNDVEIARIEFSNEQFKDETAVADYLVANGYEDFKIESTETGYFVAGMDSEQFEDVTNVEYDDGVMYFIGKLKQPVEDTPSADVIESEVLAPTNREVFEDEETKSEVEDTPSEEVVKESEAEVEEVATEVVETEEVVQESEDTAVAEDSVVDRSNLLSSAKFGSDYCDLKTQLKSAQEGGVIFTFDYIAYTFMDTAYSAVREGDMAQFKKNCNTFYSAIDSLVNASKNLAFAEDEVTDEIASTDVEVVQEAETTEVEEKFSFTKEELEQLIASKLEQNKENSKDTVDNEVIVIQNSQRIKTDAEVVEAETSEANTAVQKFKEQQKNDLFGIR